MDSVFFGAGDKIDTGVDKSNDDQRELGDNDNGLQPVEQCGDQKYDENYEDKYNLDKVFLSENNEIAQAIDTCSSKSTDISAPVIADRITECKNVIASLKLELKSEKYKLEQEYLYTKPEPQIIVPCKESDPTETKYLSDLNYPTDFFTASVDDKLYSESSFIEYEKQLQKYQKTLNIAQNAKKNAIRKQMLAKAFKLKLLEVENQCNIELLRIKQNLQCLEPLKMIAETWKTEKENFDLSKYNLIPLFPESMFPASVAESFSCDGLEFEQNKD